MAAMRSDGFDDGCGTVPADDTFGAALARAPSPSRWEAPPIPERVRYSAVGVSAVRRWTATLTCPNAVAVTSSTA